MERNYPSIKNVRQEKNDELRCAKDKNVHH